MKVGRNAEALPRLHQLDQAGGTGATEVSFFLGVLSTRCGDLQSALAWMEQSLSLNPGHAPTEEQVQNIKVALNELAE
jgi:hypothetical protein